MQSRIKQAILIGLLKKALGQETTQSSTCLCLGTVISCTTPGDFMYETEPFGSTYYIQTTSRKVCAPGILFQSTAGIQYISDCPKGGNGANYKGTPCSTNPANTGKKSLIFAQKSNDNTTLKGQIGNDGHLMKQWCGLMEWQGIFSITERCQDYSDILPILENGKPMPLGTYTQTAVCPTQSWGNGYVVLNDGKDVMTVPFDTDALVFVPNTSDNQAMYGEFAKAMDSYNRGECFQVSENMARLLNGNRMPPGYQSAQMACKSRQKQGQEPQIPSVYLPCAITASIQTNSTGCYQMQPCNSTQVGTYSWNNSTLSLQLRNNQTCQMNDNTVLNQNTTIPKSQDYQNRLIFSTHEGSCNFSFYNRQDYNRTENTWCYFDASAAITGNLTGVNQTNSPFDFGFGLDLFGNIFHDVIVIGTLIVVLMLLCCLKDAVPHHETIRIEGQQTRETSSTQDTSSSMDQASGLILILGVALSMFLWLSDTCHPEWTSYFIPSIACMSVSACLALQTRISERSGVKASMAIASVLCILIQLNYSIYFSWVGMISCYFSFSKNKSDASMFLVILMVSTFMNTVTYYIFSFTCQKWILYASQGVILCFICLLVKNQKGHRTHQSALIIQPIQMILSYKGSVLLMCGEVYNEYVFYTVITISAFASTVMLFQKPKRNRRDSEGLRESVNYVENQNGSF